MKKITLYIVFTTICPNGFSQKTLIKYLSGTDKDHTVLWDFYCSDGRKSGEWTKIKVPSNWEMQGFGTYNYGHDKVKSNEQGIYRYNFDLVPVKDKRVFIVFEGSMTDTRVRINNELAGPVHQGGFYRFKYDIISLLKPSGKNLLEVTVDKTSANPSVNSAERKSDFWIFGGIFRPVYLEVVPNVYIDRVAVNAKADGSLEMDVYPRNLKGGETMVAQVQTVNGKDIGKPFTMKTDAVSDSFRLKSKFKSPLLWSPEFPNLYQVVVGVKKRNTLHKITQKFGFRTLELRKNAGFYVNGRRTILKGSNRHSFWPETGRTLSRGVHLKDIKLMKEMNMNAVRMSHYPPDAEFLDLCDSLGLYVINELTGWQAKYDGEVGHRLVKELVTRDVNHPSIIFWANGNEGGWNTDLDNDYAIYDPQSRTVIHPWAKFAGTDTKHYPDYNYMVKAADSGQEVFFPTEFMHGLYDGGAGAGLDDFWKQMLRHPHGAGGFIWSFVDESVIRTDQNGRYDGDGNHAPDGILGPHREKEASFYAIKEIWSPIYLALPPDGESFNGIIPIENRYTFANLNQCTFKYTLIKFSLPGEPSADSKIVSRGSLVSPNLGPGIKGTLTLPKFSVNYDALYLSAFGPDGLEVFTWSRVEKKPGYLAALKPMNKEKSVISAGENNNILKVRSDGIAYCFDNATGYLQKIEKANTSVSLSSGPALAGVKTTLKWFKHRAESGNYIVEANYQGADSLQVKWTFTAGQPVKLDYTYSQQTEADFMGITFEYPEEKITGMKYLGRGPYRVWKNRLKGQKFGVWRKDYNNSITGETWGYPEFKGYHSEVNWTVIENREAPFTVYTNDYNTYLQMLSPAREQDALKNNNVEPAFPKASLGFLRGISPIGTKFQAASSLGPESQKNKPSDKSISGTLFLDFR
ncbi:glycoside hydrolase family 2 [Pedobacter frigidisoli]|uniref:beta-galactosidase n=1 Tax=Pedobacter frigidisoli TaxID=2530455 RepID=A0A4R0NZE0_9SPHI|nr:glycoside hydrolase family 2 TIM barrel-domain containing protein [Pedobacter frigidisoli]TCD05923.1 glycoside hydrolase family 2 [Pedobacter frigidisoli]